MRATMLQFGRERWNYETTFTFTEVTLSLIFFLVDTCKKLAQRFLINSGDIVSKLVYITISNGRFSKEFM